MRHDVRGVPLPRNLSTERSLLRLAVIGWTIAGFVTGLLIISLK